MTLILLVGASYRVGSEEMNRKFDTIFHMLTSLVVFYFFLRSILEGKIYYRSIVFVDDSNIILFVFLACCILVCSCFFLFLSFKSIFNKRF